jgi:uncharacterized membrane protein YcjF (UPF0283 family)
MLIMTGLMAVAIGAVIVLTRLVMEESKNQAYLRQSARQAGARPPGRDLTGQVLLVPCLLLGLAVLAWSASSWLKMLLNLALRDQQLIWTGKGLLLMLIFAGVAILVGNRLEKRSRSAYRTALNNASRSKSDLRNDRESMTSIGRR